MRYIPGFSGFLLLMCEHETIRGQISLALCGLGLIALSWLLSCIKSQERARSARRIRREDPRRKEVYIHPCTLKTFPQS